MLLYNKALDPYHTMLRMVAVLAAVSARQSSIEVDRLRILDFLVAFPSHVSLMS